ncbi:kinase-like domain-containing protein [Sporodiniella umbellata]|nr:kinase-like domain-containing protein [Sporodiniella umbellata]
MFPFTPDRSLPLSPALLPVTVIPANATNRHLHSNDNPFAVDTVELTNLLNNVKNNQCCGSHSPQTSASISGESIDSDGSEQSNKLPSQFVFKKPFYNEYYHQTHFHHPSAPCKDSAWSDLVKLFVTESYNTNDLFGNQFKQNIQNRYGKWGRFIGKGAGGSVRLIQRNNTYYAAKQFRKRRTSETEKDYIKKLTAEFCIGSTLHHPNIIQTLDMVQQGDQLYEIMEYAPNDLFNIVMSGMMSKEEIACCWKQLLNGLSYLHSMGIAHRDLKLDNVVLDHLGILKIIDFGCSTVFKYPFDSNIIMTQGVFGSDPYISPEQFTQTAYDPKLSDVWSCGIIFVCMSIRRFPWRVPRLSDPAYKSFVTNENQQKYRLLNLLPKGARSVMASILEAKPSYRYSLETILKDNWVRSIDICSIEEPGACHVHHVSVMNNQRGNLVAVTPEPPGLFAEKRKTPVCK